MKNGRFGDMEDRENSSDNSEDSVADSSGDHQKVATSSQKKSSRKALQKKVVSIPIKDLEYTSRNKGEAAPPPSDSWTWRKYGQKPIKGSPYPRGYYRCSSSKGCPARKQVERSRVDPTMLVVTYSSNHNHQSPSSSKNNHRYSTNGRQFSPPIAAVYDGDDDGVAPVKSEIQETIDTKPITANDDKENSSINVAATDDFHGWFDDIGCATMLESPILAETSSNDTDVSMLFPIMGEEEEYLFADLGELPECSVVFRRSEVAGGTEWCRTTL